MASVTDDERRRVAAELRGMHDYETATPIIRTCLGLRPGMLMDDETRRRMSDRLADLIEPDEVTGETSDGYHTFNELYDHRAKLFSVIVRDHREIAWKSRLHHDGTMYDGMFIVGVETPGGQATYHYDVDPYWGIFDCEELDRAPEWDGHTPQQAIDRIAALGPSCDREALLALDKELTEFYVTSGSDGDELVMSRGAVSLVARRIREACGVVA